MRFTFLIIYAVRNVAIVFALILPELEEDFQSDHLTISVAYKPSLRATIQLLTCNAGISKEEGLLKLSKFVSTRHSH